MFKIVKITTQKNNKERFNVYVDRGTADGEDYFFSLDQDVLIEFRLKKGNTYTEEELKEILYKDKIKKAYQLALKFLTSRMKSEKEMREYLLSKSYEEEIVSIVINKLKEHQYINDLEFAKAFVRSRMNQQVKGPLLIRQELQQKGVSEEYINEGLKEYPEEKQFEIASQFAQKFAKQKKGLTEYQGRQKIGQTLLSKGFTLPIAKRASNELVIEQDEQELLLAVMKHGEKAYKKYSNKYEGWELEQRVKQYLYQRGFRVEEIEAFIAQYKEMN